MCEMQGDAETCKRKVAAMIVVSVDGRLLSASTVLS